MKNDDYYTVQICGNEHNALRSILDIFSENSNYKKEVELAENFLKRSLDKFYENCRQ